MTESQNRDLWFTLPPQRFLLVWWLFSAIPIPILKFPIFIHLVIIIIIITRTASHTTKYIHQRDSPPVRLLGGECIIPKSTQYVTVVTDIIQ